VEKEWNICMAQQADFPDFQIIPVRLDACEPPAALGIHKWIDLNEQGLSAAAVTQILEALHWHETEPAGAGRRQVYFARGAKNDEEVAAAKEIGKQLHKAGFRVVRDAPDHPHMDDSRVRMIMQGCGGVVALLSHRGGGRTSPFFLRELRVGRTLGLPVLVVAEEAVTEFEVGASDRVVRIANLAAAEQAGVRQQIDEFGEILADPPRPAHCFFGHTFKGPDLELFGYARRCVQSTTGVPCISGDEILGGNAQEQITARIRDATFCIFDITEDRLNSCVEAGIAIGAGTPFEIITQGTRRTPPYMFRKWQLHNYADGKDLIGLVRKLSAPYRRVVN
jgi:hypothetical protein